MKGQNIKEYQQKEVNLMFKTDKKTRNYIFLCHVTKCLTEAEKIECAKMSYYWLRRTNWNQIQQNFHSCTKMAHIWESNGQ